MNVDDDRCEVLWQQTARHAVWAVDDGPPFDGLDDKTLMF